MNTYTEISCAVCMKYFSRELRYVKYEQKKAIEENRIYNPICSLICKKKFHTNKQAFTCKNCDKPLERTPGQLKKVINSFCNRTCSAQFNNKQRTLVTETKDITCKYCDSIISIKTTSIKKVCDLCKKKNKQADSKKCNKQSNCLKCDKEIYSCDGNKKYCDICRAYSI